jgi:hypothetical protein
MSFDAPVYLQGISEKARLILDHLVSVYEESGIDLPARRFIAIGGPGQTVHSQAQVTVSWEQAYSGLPQHQGQFPVKRTQPWTGVFVVEVVRDLPGMPPSGREPSVDTLNAVADQQMQDAQLMIEAGRRSFENSWEQSGMADISASIPQGLLQAVTMNVMVVI